MKISIQSFLKKTAEAIDLNLMSDTERDSFERRTSIDQARYLGFGQNNRQNFDTPSYIPQTGDAVYRNGNSSIVLGLDRPSNIFSGFGGRKNTHCAAIDMVAGRMGYRSAKRTAAGLNINSDPNFKLDASRVYISQKSDPDGYFGLVEGSVGNTSKSSPRSTVALKADTLRFIARENIKLVTRTDSQNSQGGNLGDAFVGNYGIDLIAMNDDKDLQPLVKGDSLVSCLQQIIKNVHDLSTLLDNYLEYNRLFMKAVIKHTHHSPFFGYSTAPDFEGIFPAGIEALIDMVTNVQLQLNSHMQTLNNVDTNHLRTPGGAAAEKDGKSQYILSRYNHTN